MPETNVFPTNVGAGDGTADTALKQNFVLHNRYKIMGVLGGGGMGTVYQARDLNFTDVRKLVAVKEMHTIAPDAAMRTSMMKTFQREANILATLSHPAIPKIFDFFDLNDRVYIVMEYINGSDLELILQKTKDIPIDKLIEWGIELCDVLGYLHDQKPQPVVFRDMKPSNVMIDSLGRVRLIDFGIAKSFVSGVKNTMIGTEGYSAPEQYKGDISPQSDIYSLGATLHHLLTRKDPRLEPPFSFNERPIGDANPTAPPGLIAVVNKALSFNPTERYTSCTQMKSDLEGLRYRPQPTFSVNVGALPNGAAGVPTIPSPIAPDVIPTSMFEEVVGGTIQPRWTFKTEDEIRCSPMVFKEFALIGSYDTNMWALKLDTGELGWKFATRGGIASSPIIDESNRYVLFGSEDFTFYAVDYRNGRVAWTFQTKDRIRSTARLAHDHIFFGSDDGKVYALGALNGRQIWSFDFGSPIRSRPFVTNELVIVGGESGEIIAITLSGNRKWSYRTKRSVMSSPFVDMNEGVCFIGSSDNFLYALEANTGYNSWRFRTNGPIISSPAMYKTLVIFGSADGNLYALNSQSGREKWKFKTDKPIVASPIVHRDAVYFGSTDQILYCLDAETGKERWKFKTGGAITATPYVAGDLLLIGSMDHTLYALPLVS